MRPATPQPVAVEVVTPDATCAHHALQCTEAHRPLAAIIAGVGWQDMFFTCSRAPVPFERAWAALRVEYY